MQLISPCIDMAQAFITAAKEYRALSERYYRRELVERNMDLDRDFSFGRYIESLEQEARGVNLLPGRVAQTTYWLVDDDGTAILGTSRLRHHLTPELEMVGGHIGYDVHPLQRRKGYGTLILKLTLERAREFGLRKVLITCDADNIGSQKIILHNDGVLENEIYSDEEQKSVKRYWIEL